MDGHGRGPAFYVCAGDTATDLGEWLRRGRAYRSVEVAIEKGRPTDKLVLVLRGREPARAVIKRVVYPLGGRAAKGQDDTFRLGPVALLRTACRERTTP